MLPAELARYRALTDVSDLTLRAKLANQAAQQLLTSAAALLVTRLPRGHGQSMNIRTARRLI